MDQAQAEIEVAQQQENPMMRSDSKSELQSNFMEKAKLIVSALMESLPYVITMAVVTIWALFSDDIRLASTDSSGDLGFEVIISIVFFMFLIEIFGTSFYKPEYVNVQPWEPQPGDTLWMTWKRRLKIGSFYFWLDWIATTSLIFEIEWFNINLAGSSKKTSNRAGQGARTGARAGRVVRLVRMVRLIRLVKLYKYVSTATGKQNDKVKTGGDAEEEEEMAPESHVGAAMSDLTNKRVVLLVLAMLMVMPFLTATDPDLSQELAWNFMARFTSVVDSSQVLSSANLTAFNYIVKRSTKTPINAYYIQLFDTVFADDPGLDSRLRTTEKNCYNQDGLSACFSIRNEVKQGALFSIYTTIFLIVLLVSGTYFFSQDVNKMVIGPIEKMVELVHRISVNPLGVEYKMLGEKDGFVDGMETTILLTTITKIGSLMRVGFGEAGASVIAKNLADSTGGRLNLMGGGTMIHSIFGFCDVRQFTDTTECLQEEVMLFVNRIAHILHGIVVQCSGSANKNIGDAFLLTWKLDEKLTPTQVANLADQALLAFCKTLVELIRHEEFICNFSVAATARLFKRFPGYHVRIGSGLHVGWAIEGAIGSNRKIDASYLSPHVNFTEFLESSTKAYGVPLLMSENFYELLSPAAKRYCRQVDRLSRSAAEKPIGLYTYDSDLNVEFANPQRARPKVVVAPPGGTRSMSVSVQAPRGRSNSVVGASRPPMKNNSIVDLEAAAAAAAAEKKKDEAPVITIKPYTQDIWDDDDDLVDLRHRVNDAFRAIWADGMSAYIKGDWQKARDIFHETMRLSNDKDGPSKHLIELIDEHGGSAPHDWPGYRMEGGGH